MMKKLMIMLMFLILVVGVSALYGGESFTLYDEDCNHLEISITGVSDIVLGELRLSDNCEILENGNFNCSCDEPIVLSTSVNAVNVYTAEIDIWKELESQTASDSGSGASSSRKWSSVKPVISAVEEKEESRSEEILDSEDEEGIFGVEDEGQTANTGITNEPKQKQEEDNQGLPTGFVTKETDNKKGFITVFIDHIINWLKNLFK